MTSPPPKYFDEPQAPENVEMPSEDQAFYKDTRNCSFDDRESDWPSGSQHFCSTVVEVPEEVEVSHLRSSGRDGLRHAPDMLLRNARRSSRSTPLQVQEDDESTEYELLNLVNDKEAIALLERHTIDDRSLRTDAVEKCKIHGSDVTAVFRETFQNLEKMEKEKNPEGDDKRDTWSKKIDFAFSIAGGFIGLGNVWRFPYLCFKNGGGAFLIPYVLFVIVGALPVFFLEVTVGQYTRRGAALAWMIVPIMKGLGVAVNLINYYTNIYYAVILAWSLRYFFASMASELPWSTCGNVWNTNSCFVFGAKDINGTAIFPNSTDNSISSVVEYWEKGVLGLSSGIAEAGHVQWELLLCLMLTWVIIYFCIWKGIGWTSKVVYFTATFPILMLLVLLVRGATLDGASDGIIFYLKPELHRLQDVQVWLDAAAQVFYSYALCKGMLTTMGSYNKYKYNSYRDCVILACFNSGVSFISGFAIFSVLGFMAKEQGQNITEVAESGPGLAFIAYPKALALMPLPQFWGCLFFLMLFLLGLDTEFVGQETLMTAFLDMKPKFFKKPWRKEIFLAFLSLSQFLFGISMITQGGVYVLNIFDNYGAAGWCMLFISFFQCTAIAWIFGINKFWDRVCEMVGFRPLPWLKWCWAVLTPLATVTLFVISLTYYKSPTYNRTSSTYVYPPWAVAFAWMLAMSSMIWIPGYAMYRFVVAKGSFRERLVEVTTSEYDDSHRLDEYHISSMDDDMKEHSKNDKIDGFHSIDPDETGQNYDIMPTVNGEDNIEQPPKYRG